MSFLIDLARLTANWGVMGRNIFGPDGLERHLGSAENLAAALTSTTGDMAGFGAGFVRYGMGIDMELIARGLFSKADSETLSALRTRGPETSMGSFILWTITVVEALELTMGFGPAHEGDGLKAGSAQFSTIGDELASALPDERWQGSASQAYADQVKALQALAKTLAELDLKLADIVKNQADWVTHMRLGFGILKHLLVAAFVSYWAIMLTLPTPANISIAKAFEIAVCLAGVTAALGMLGTLFSVSIKNAVEATALTTRYNEAAAGAQPSETPVAHSQVAAAAETTVSSFNYSAVSTPPPPATPNPAGDSDAADQHAPLSALSAEGQTRCDGTPETSRTPAAPETATSAASAFTMPTLNQLAHASRGAAPLSGNITPHATFIDQAKAQIQQLARIAQQARATRETAPLPAVPHVPGTLAGDAELAGPAAGTQAAGRAPVDVIATPRPAMVA